MLGRFGCRDRDLPLNNASCQRESIRKGMWFFKMIIGHSDVDFRYFPVRMVHHFTVEFDWSNNFLQHVTLDFHCENRLCLCVRVCVFTRKTEELQEGNLAERPRHTFNPWYKGIKKKTDFLFLSVSHGGWGIFRRLSFFTRFVWQESRRDHASRGHHWRAQLSRTR